MDIQIGALFLGFFAFNYGVTWEFKYVIKSLIRRKEFNFQRFSKWYIIPSSWIRKKFHIPKHPIPFFLVVDCYYIVVMKILGIIQPFVFLPIYITKPDISNFVLEVLARLIVYLMMIAGIFTIIFATIMNRK